jgi:hypothetical protein
MKSLFLHSTSFLQILRYEESSESLFDSQAMIMSAASVFFEFLAQKKIEEDIEFDTLFKPETVIPSDSDEESGSDDKEPDDKEPEDTESEDTEPEDTEPEDTEPEDTEPEDVAADGDHKQRKKQKRTRDLVPINRTKRVKEPKKLGPGYQNEEKLIANQAMGFKSKKKKSTDKGIVKPKNTSSRKPPLHLKTKNTKLKKTNTKVKGKTANVAVPKDPSLRDDPKQSQKPEAKSSNSKLGAAVNSPTVTVAEIDSVLERKQMKSMRKIARSEMKLREEANTSMWKMASVQINTFNQMMSNSIHATRGELDVTAAGVVETGTPLITTAHNTAQGTPAQAMTMQVPGGNYANYASGVPMMPQGFYGAHAYNMMPPPPHGTYSGYGYAGQGGMMYQAHAHAQASS